MNNGASTLPPYGADDAPEAGAIIDARVSKVEALFSEEADVPETFAAGDKRILDFLDQLPPTHPARYGLRVTLEYIGPDRVARMVPGDWADDLPTQARVSDLVGAGHARPGKYRVLLMRGRKTMPHIRFDVAPPLMPEAAAPADPVQQFLNTARALRELERGGGAPMTPEDASGLAGELEALAEEHASLVERVADLDERLGALEGLAQQLAQGGAEDAGGGIGQLLELVKHAGDLGALFGSPAPGADLVPAGGDA